MSGSKCSRSEVLCAVCGSQLDSHFYSQAQITRLDNEVLGAGGSRRQRACGVVLSPEYTEPIRRERARGGPHAAPTATPQTPRHPPAHPKVIPAHRGRAGASAHRPPRHASGVHDDIAPARPAWERSRNHGHGRPFPPCSCAFRTAPSRRKPVQSCGVVGGVGDSTCRSLIVVGSGHDLACRGRGERCWLA